jgi:hypothetical protein
MISTTNLERRFQLNTGRKTFTAKEVQWLKLFNKAYKGQIKWYKLGLSARKQNIMRDYVSKRTTDRKRDLLNVSTKQRMDHMKKPLRKGYNYYTMDDYSKIPVDMEAVIISDDCSVLDELLDRPTELKAIGRVEVGDTVMMCDPNHDFYNKRGQLLEIRVKPMTQTQYRVKFGSTEIFLRREDLVRTKKG